MINKQLHQEGFVIVKNMLSPNIRASLFNYMEQLEVNGVGLSDDFVDGSVYFYKHPIFEVLLKTLLPRIEDICGCELFKTYSYARQYKIGNELPSHRDREACEFTVSILLGYEGKPWPLWITSKENRTQEISLDNGDAVIFKGIELYHWREVNSFGDCSQVFLHYVNKAGEFAQHMDDCTFKHIAL